MTTGTGYDAAQAAFTQELRGIFAPPEEAAATRSATRGAQAESPEVLAERAERLVDVSLTLGTMTAELLDGDDAAAREAAETKLLAQATAELEVARGLLEIAAAETKAESATRSAAPVRSSGTAGLQASLDQLSGVLEAPLGDGMTPYLSTRAVRGGGIAPDGPDAAKAALQTEVGRSVRTISRRSAKVSGKAARTLLLMDAETLRKGVSVVSEDAAKLIDQLVSGLSVRIRKLVSSALRLLLQAYDWVLALLGKDVEAKARQQVADWLGELRTEGSEENEGSAVAALVDRIYAPAAIEADVTKWMEDTTADTEALAAATESVRLLAEKHAVKAEQVEGFLKVAGLAKVVPLGITQTPQFHVLVAGVVLGLLGYALYAGYDYVDSGQITFRERFGITIPDRVSGVHATAEHVLVAPSV